MANWTFGEKEKKRYGEILSSAVKNIYDQQQEQQQAAAQAAEKDADIRAQYPVSQVYDSNTDYMALMQQYANQGDWANAARAEQQRNSKITGEGLDTSLYTNLYSQYLPENRYRYDPSQNEAYTAAKAQQDAIFEKIMNRGDFRYNVEDDPLYQQYRDQYTALGKNAMRDTMGQAAALTGGYGSTYAQQAGQQSYDAYLARLNDIVPELYGAAYNRYQDDGNALLNRYNMAAGQATDAYNQGYNAWSTRLGLEREDEANAYNRRIAEQQMQYQQQQQAYSDLTSLIAGTGYTPTDAELAAAGMTRARADALKAEYEYQKSLAAASFSSGGGSGRSSSGGSGRRSSGGSGGGSGSTALNTNTQSTREQVRNEAHEAVRQMSVAGRSREEIRQLIDDYVKNGGLDESYAAVLMQQYVLVPETKSTSGKSGARGGGKTNTRGEY